MVKSKTNYMNKIHGGVLLTLLGLVLSPFRLGAIEGLKISVTCPDVILSWPSKTGETYVVQYRATLNTNDPWVTLTNTLPAALNTNSTRFIHTNVSECPQVGSGQSASLQTDRPTTTVEERAARREQYRQEIQAMLEKMMGDMQEAATLAASNRAWKKANGVTTTQVAASSSETTSPAESEAISSTGVGFYRVVRTGVSLFGVTSGQVFSGVVSLPIEIGVASGNNVLTEVTLAPLSSQETEDKRPAGVELYVLNAANRDPFLLWDTHRTTNGTYVLKAAVTLNGDNLITGVPVNVVVANQIQMPKIPDVMVSGLPIYAIIDQPSASYTITIQNAGGQVRPHPNRTSRQLHCEHLLEWPRRQWKQCLGKS